MAASKGNGHGIVINFSAEVRDVIEATKDIEVSATEMYQAFQQGADESVTKYEEMTDAQQAEFRKQFDNAEDLQRGITRLAQEELRNKQIAAGKYEQVAKETFRKVGRDAEESSDDVAKSTEKGFGKASSSAKEAGREIGDGLKDVVTDFDGSMESVGSGVSNTLSGIAAIIPGIGGFIGAGLASVASGLFKTWDENASKTEQRVSDMYNTLLESGTNYQTKAQIGAAVNDLLGDPDARAAAIQDAKDLGLAVSDVAIALVADGPQREAALARLNDLLAENSKRSAEATSEREKQQRAIERLPLDALATKFSDLARDEGNALNASQIGRRALEDINETYNEQGAAIDRVTDSLNALPQGRTVKVTADVSEVEAALRRIPKILPLEARVFTRDGKRVY